MTCREIALALKSCGRAHANLLDYETSHPALYSRVSH